MTNFPPSLSRVPPPSKSTDHHEQQLEKEKKRKARLRAVEEAMRGLPLKRGADGAIPKLSGLFEKAFYAALNRIEDKPATTRTMGAELKALAKGLAKVVDQIDGLHRDTVQLWAAGADPAMNSAALLLVLSEAESWADAGIDTLKRAKRIGGRGRTEDIKARWMRETAASVYEQLTTRKANVAYDAYGARESETPFTKFLKQIHEIYGLKASAKSRARKRGRMAKK